ncbi:MAG TPA: presqualene diphosphate synthase HpnD [Gemmatimonadaceae bacterium]|nr:presqualene diphosphate synthase HpnD [Gemmatimonadaceae bacterium]
MARPRLEYLMARNTSFYFAFLSLPRERRDAIITLWDFCRAADDAVDLATDPEQARRELETWRREVAACFEERAPATVVGRALALVVRQFNLPRPPFEDLLDGVAMDLTQQRYEAFNDLYQYCLRVASAVGLLSVEIFGYRSAGARDYAIELGLALQLTNILRDVPSDMARGRIYIPLEDLRKFSVSEEDLRAGVMTPALRELLAFEGARARQYFARARQALPREDTRRLVAAEIMGAIYFDLLRRIERAGFDVFRARMSVPRYRRAWVALRTWIRVTARSVWA